MSKAKAGLNRPETYFDTLPPDAISDELAPVIEELGLEENCRELTMQGWTVIKDEIRSVHPCYRETFHQTVPGP